MKIRQQSAILVSNDQEKISSYDYTVSTSLCGKCHLHPASAAAVAAVSSQFCALHFASSTPLNSTLLWHICSPESWISENT